LINQAPRNPGKTCYSGGVHYYPIGNRRANTAYCGEGKGCNVAYETLGIRRNHEGKVTIKALRDVNYQDLLGRQPVQLDSAGIRDYLADRVVMVTGCGVDWFGLCRQVVHFNRTLIL
jgi:FlaA1/EpsC-like NDP-sugar epimerase